MATNPKERLKDLIEALDEDDARELLAKIESASPTSTPFDEIEDVHQEIQERFEDAFQELAEK